MKKKRDRICKQCSKVFRSGRSRYHCDKCVEVRKQMNYKGKIEDGMTPTEVEEYLAHAAALEVAPAWIRRAYGRKT